VLCYAKWPNGCKHVWPHHVRPCTVTIWHWSWLLSYETSGRHQPVDECRQHIVQDPPAELLPTIDTGAAVYTAERAMYVQPLCHLLCHLKHKHVSTVLCAIASNHIVRKSHHRSLSISTVGQFRDLSMCGPKNWLQIQQRLAPFILSLSQTAQIIIYNQFNCCKDSSQW